MRERERSIRRGLTHSPLRIWHGAKLGARSEVGTVDPVGLVLEDVAARLTVHNLKGSSRIRRVAEVLVAGHATHARRQDGVPGGAAGRRAPRREAAEETAAGLLDGVQLPAGDAVLLLDVLARIQGRHATLPVDVHGTDETSVEVRLRRDVHLSQTVAALYDIFLSLSGVSGDTLTDTRSNLPREYANVGELVSRSRSDRAATVRSLIRNLLTGVSTFRQLPRGG